MVEYITARTTTNGASAEHLTMERELQIADLSQRLDRAEKRPGSDRVEWQWPGVLCPTPNPPSTPSTPPQPPTFVPTHILMHSLQPIYSRLSSAVIQCTGFVLCWIQARDVKQERILADGTIHCSAVVDLPTLN